MVDPLVNLSSNISFDSYFMFVLKKYERNYEEIVEAICTNDEE